MAGIQFGGAPSIPPTASGWPTYAEEAVGMSHVFQSQLTSLISEGTFAEFPELRVTMVEGGWTWLPSLMWRPGQELEGARREILDHDGALGVHPRARPLHNPAGRRAANLKHLARSSISSARTTC